MPPHAGPPQREESYLLATRHPWPCLLFLLPLLLAYEGGVLYLGGAHANALRNGADAWLRWLLAKAGVHQVYWVPATIALVFLVWSWLRRGDRPVDLMGVLTGMGIESTLFALGLWGVSRGLPPLLSRLGMEMATSPADRAVGQVITFVGAGIYEELLFRLLLFVVLKALLYRAQAPVPVAVGFAALTSAALFSVAHHLGPYGEPFDSTVFLFRLLAGLYFACLFQLRGFGIAVGAHACYDVLVGVTLG